MKKFLSICLTLAMMLSLAACAGAGAGAQTEQKFQKSDHSSITETKRDPIEEPRVEKKEPVQGVVSETEESEQAEPEPGERKDVTYLVIDEPAGERYLIDEFFGKTDISVAELSDLIGEEVCDLVGEEVVKDLRMILTSYSLEGVYRDLEHGDEFNGVTRKAMVLICWMVGVEFDNLFTYEYMTAEEAEPIFEVIQGVSIW